MSRINIKLRRKSKHRQGFFLVELIITIAILIIVITGYLSAFIYCLSLAESSKNTTLAALEAQDKLEEIRNDSFSNLLSYNGQTFSLAQLNGTGYIYVFATGGDANLLTIEVVASWYEKGSRLIGGSDEDGDGRVDSPVEVVSMIAKKY